jgi:WD40 repeat protein
VAQHTLEGHTQSIISVAFSPDGTRVVSGSSDNTLRLWDAASGMHLDTLDGHCIAVPSVALSTSSTPTLDPGSAGPLCHEGWVNILSYQATDLLGSCCMQAAGAGGNRAALCPPGGKVVILDFTGMRSYFRDR